MLKSRIGDVFYATKARVIHGSQKSILYFQIFSVDTRAKTSKGAAQSAREKLTHDKFEALTSFRFRLETQSDYPSWTREDRASANEGFSLEELVRARKEVPKNAIAGL